MRREIRRGRGRGITPLQLRILLTHLALRVLLGLEQLKIIDSETKLDEGATGFPCVPWASGSWIFQKGEQWNGNLGERQLHFFAGYAGRRSYNTTCTVRIALQVVTAPLEL